MNDTIFPVCPSYCPICARITSILRRLVRNVMGRDAKAISASSVQFF